MNIHEEKIESLSEFLDEIDYDYNLTLEIHTNHLVPDMMTIIEPESGAELVLQNADIRVLKGQITDWIESELGWYEISDSLRRGGLD